MIHRILVAAFAALSLVAVDGLALAADAGLVRKPSPYPVAQTLDRLADIATGKGATVFARIDHAAGAERAGMALRPTETLIFGNPKLGTPVMAAAQEAGLDLPMRVLAYQAADGQVWLAYRQPSAFTAHGVAADLPALENIGKALNALTDAAVAK